MSNLLAPAVTARLWPVLRDRINTPLMQDILDGTTRCYVEGDYEDAEGPETELWARAVIVPVEPLEAPRFIAGLGTPAEFLVRVDVNSTKGPRSTILRIAQKAQMEAYSRLHRFTGPLSVSAALDLMLASDIQQTRMWGNQMLEDPVRTGSAFLSSAYWCEVAQPPVA